VFRRPAAWLLVHQFSVLCPCSLTVSLPSSAHDCTLPIGKRRGKWNPVCCCLFSALSDQLLSHVLHYLPLTDRARMAFVSTRWHFSVLQPSLWSHVHASADAGPAALALLHASPFGTMVSSLDMPKLRAASIVAPRLPSATSIYLKHSILPAGFAASLFSSTPLLRTLCLDASSGVDSSSLAVLSATAASLEVLSLKGCVIFSQSCLLWWLPLTLSVLLQVPPC
jgi:hypothetical protein